MTDEIEKNIQNHAEGTLKFLTSDYGFTHTVSNILSEEDDAEKLKATQLALHELDFIRYDLEKIEHMLKFGKLPR